jgi:hypothetical protein
MYTVKLQSWHGGSQVKYWRVQAPASTVTAATATATTAATVVRTTPAVHGTTENTFEQLEQEEEHRQTTRPDNLPADSLVESDFFQS